MDVEQARLPGDHVGVEAQDHLDRRASRFVITIPAAAHRPAVPAVLALDQFDDLLGYLAQVADRGCPARR
jgi:hypothetical protein